MSFQTSHSLLWLMKGIGAVRNIEHKGPLSKEYFRSLKILQLCPKAAKQRFGDLSRQARLTVISQSLMQLRGSANQSPMNLQRGIVIIRLTFISIFSSFHWLLSIRFDFLTNPPCLRVFLIHLKPRMHSPIYRGSILLFYRLILINPFFIELFAFLTIAFSGMELSIYPPLICSTLHGTR